MFDQPDIVVNDADNRSDLSSDYFLLPKDSPISFEEAVAFHLEKNIVPVEFRRGRS